MKVHEQITEQTWCKGYIAKDVDGDKCCVNSAYAVCWCFIGWLYKVYGSVFTDEMESRKKVDDAIEVLYPQYAGYCISDFNDHPDVTFEMVKAVSVKADV